jgi:hypothetical protein
MSTISNFVNTVIAIIKGDDAEVIGLKYKRAVAVLTAQIASMQNSFFRRNRRSC